MKWKAGFRLGELVTRWGRGWGCVSWFRCAWVGADMVADLLHKEKWYLGLTDA